MINLLPSELKENTLYARRNTRLLRWAIITLAIIMGIVLIIGLGQLYLARTTTTYKSQTEDARQALEAQHLEQTQASVESISGNLKLIDQVLSKEVLFSKLIRQMGAVMPARSVLSNIEISKLEGGLDLTASAQDYQTATQVQVNLEDPANKLFDKVDIIAVNCGAAPKSGFPCTVTLRALFAKNNPYLFINSKSATGQTP